MARHEYLVRAPINTTAKALDYLLPSTKGVRPNGDFTIYVCRSEPTAQKQAQALAEAGFRVRITDPEGLIVRRRNAESWVEPSYPTLPELPPEG